MKVKLKRKEAIKLVQNYKLLYLSIEEKGNILLGYGLDVMDDNDSWIIENILDERNNKIIKKNYSYSKLVTNEYLANEILDLYKVEIEIIDSVDLDLSNCYSCVCCGYVISKKRQWHNICPVCGWQDDHSDENDYSSPNRASLHDYRNNYMLVKGERMDDKKFIKYYKL